MNIKLRLHLLVLVALVKSRMPAGLTRLLSLSLLLATGPAFAQSTAFTYNGRLNNNGAPVSGPHDMRFTLYDANAAGVAVAGPLATTPVDVANGLFTVRIDFGANIFTGPARWLHVEVRPVGGANYSVLTPRQEVTSSPYAIRAETAGTLMNGAVTAGQLNTAGVAPAPGQFLSYDGGNLTWTAPGVAAGNIWSLLNGNAYYSAGNVGIGTSTPTAGIRLDVVGAAIIRPGNGNIQFGSPSGELGFSVIPTANNSRADLRFDGTTLKLLASTNATPPSALNGLAITTAGNVGIGVNAPAAGYRLEVAGATQLRPGNGTIQFGSPNSELGLSITPNAGNRADLRFDGSLLKLVVAAGVVPPSAANGIVINTAGNVGIGSTTPQSKLEVVGQDALRLVGYQPFLTLLDSNAGYARSRIQGVNGEIVLEPESFVNGSNPNASVVIANSGNVSLRTLTIRGGADVAEPFELSGRDIAKGSVVVIDEEHAGKLKLSTRAYDTQVAGIVSGANGIEPGISLYQQGALEGGHNVALSGRVYVLADAAGGAIKPGDLLTTSGTPGHAMKVADHGKAQGAILGKAMSPLKEGKGMVLVLVSLQ
jgi:hypothetical protein